MLSTNPKALRNVKRWSGGPLVTDGGGSKISSAAWASARAGSDGVDGPPGAAGSGAAGLAFDLAALALGPFGVGDALGSLGTETLTSLG